MSIRHALLAICLSGLVAACGHAPPEQTHDACLILEDNRAWWRDLRRSEDRWGVSPGIQLAILRRESSFNAHARPARQRLFGVIPGRRPSSAYGYAQALDSTWDWYREETGRRGADRDDFGDATDFIGWYSHMSGRLSGISPTDGRSLYLAYHQGHTGYNQGTYRGIAWLNRAASQVATDASRYDSQISQCRRRLDRRFLGVF
ncbi:hypothetical protein V0U79_00565 [Hyphobacterium sp. HN65]|uniref:Transglycosylase SLT domain-containing protein n=1 Tax=Hyphobacterium lacteum TaxID=3116575 RepID=A0ABU7LMM7_9PROT|nr:hypothetical protein [Hyphobacterium sp. HN65]MEE2524844.1 hypothetical protein [Hyphobacterium sp. HN65]